MKKRLFALLLTAAMLVAMTACGGGAASAPETSTAQPSSPESVVPEEVSAPEAPVETAAPEVSAMEEASVVEPVEETPFNDTVIEYPLADGETLRIFCAKPGGPPIVRDSWGEVEFFQNAEEHLGVHVEWNEVDMMAMSTQFNLMVASGDYPDIISGVVELYSTGAVGAYENGVIMDFADLTYDNMPNYWNRVHADSEIEKYVMTEEGNELAVYVANDMSLTERGFLIRKDWLDAVGLEVPETFDQLEEALTAFKNTYNCSNALYVGDSGLGVPALTGGYDIAYFDDDLALYVDDGQLVCSYMTEKYRDFLETMNRWINAGLLNGDMILNAGSISMNDTQTYICTEQTGAFHTSANQLSTYYSSSENPAFDVTPINVVVQNPGDDTINHFGAFEMVQSRQTLSVSTDCENPELALRWMDYWYSDEGTEYMTYGTEGLSYEKDANGVPQFTALVTDNEEGYSPATMIMKYNCQGKLCGVMLQKAFWDYYTPKQQEVMDFWSSQVEYDRSVPGYVTLNTEETTNYNAIVSDILSYAESELTKFLFGERDFSEWDAFTAELEAMGINDAIAIYQGAYDRFV